MASDKKVRAIEVVRPVLAEVVKILNRERVKHQVCGSMRREVSMVGDVDIVVESKRRAILALNGFSRATIIPNKTGDGYHCVIQGIQFDFYQASEDNWGAMTLFLTGSQLFNILMRGAAKKQGYKLNQYGLWHFEELIAAKTEELIFDALGFKYVPPTKRSITPQNKNQGRILQEKF